MRAGPRASKTTWSERMTKPHPNDPRLAGTALNLRHDGGGGLQPSGGGDEGIDLDLVGATLRDNVRLIMRMAGAVFALVMIVTFLSHMEFRSTAGLYLGELSAKSKEGGGGNAQDMDLSGGQGDVGSELEILKSRSLVARAVQAAGLNASLTHPDWTPPRFWKWRLSGRDPSLLDGGGSEVYAVNTSMPHHYRGEREFTVKFRNATEYELYSDGQMLGMSSLDKTLTVPDNVTLSVRAGAHSKPSAGSEYVLTVMPLDLVVDDTLDALAISMPKAGGTEPAKVLTLEFKHGSPYLAAAFLRELMNGYLEERQAWKSENATAAEAFVTEQLKSLRESLEASQKKLAEYRSNTRVVVLNEEAKSMIDQMSKYEQQRVAARLEVAALGDMKRALRNPQSRLEAFLLGESTDTVLKELATSLSKARSDLIDLEQRFNSASPDVQNQRAKVNAQAEMVRNYIDSRLARAQDNLSAMNNVIGQFEAKLKTVPGAEMGLAQMARESEVFNRTYSYLLERQQQAGIAKASTVSKNRVLDPPRIPYKEDSPKLLLRMASVFLGLLLGVIVVLLRRFLSPTLQSERELRAAAADVSVFACVPRESLTQALPESLPLATTVPVLTVDHRSAYAEAFRTLRTNLSFASWSAGGNVVLITSPCPGDGKTTTTLSLAAVLAADGKQVLVIDGDLRKPSHHEILHHRNAELGLRGVLVGQHHWRDAVQPVSSSFGEFYSMGAGTTAAVELLSSERMARLLAETRARFDYVLIDSASFPLVADALVLSREADCVLSVLRLQHTPRKLMNEHIRRLRESSRNYGIVVNDASSPLNGYGSVYPGSVPPQYVRPATRSLRDAVQGLPGLGKKG
jgi:capsular exopolysaccharide synthesis family protein